MLVRTNMGTIEQQGASYTEVIDIDDRSHDEFPNLHGLTATKKSGFVALFMFLFFVTQ